MHILGLIISLLVIGLIAGFLARLIVPGKQALSIVATIVLGVVGSFVGGFLGYLIFHKDGQNGFFQTSGIIGSIIGAIIVLLCGPDSDPKPAADPPRCHLSPAGRPQSCDRLGSSMFAPLVDPGTGKVVRCVPSPARTAAPWCFSRTVSA